MLAGVVAALLIGHGVDGGLVQGWLTEMEAGGDLADVDLLGERIVQQIIKRDHCLSLT